MKNTAILLIVFLVSIGNIKSQSNFFDFSMKTLEGTDFNFSTLKGKKIMLVNVASKCGLTPQYTDLQKLYDNYKDQNFIIIAFPANNFLNQEPGTAEEIRDFCTKNYGVTFPVMEKISVKGKDMHPLYQWLTRKALNGVEDSEVQWNFQKYLINPDGSLFKVISPRTLPQDQEIINWITSQ